MRASLRVLAVVSATILSVALCGGIANAQDSGVRTKGCSGGTAHYGLLTFTVADQSNSYAPGDYISTGSSQFMEHHPATSVATKRYDYQNNGINGGQYRVASGGTYTNLAATCSTFG